VHLHEPIETAGLKKEDLPALQERIRREIAGPVEASLKAIAQNQATPASETTLED